MKVIEECRYCDTALVIEDENGTRYDFNGHTAETCRLTLFGQVKGLKTSIAMSQEAWARAVYQHGQIRGDQDTEIDSLRELERLHAMGLVDTD